MLARTRTPVDKDIPKAARGLYPEAVQVMVEVGLTTLEVAIEELVERKHLRPPGHRIEAMRRWSGIGDSRCRYRPHKSRRPGPPKGTGPTSHNLS